jgi:hypothetical protein
VILANKYYRRDGTKREKVRTETMMMRKELNRLAMLKPLPNGVSRIIRRDGILSLRNQHANPKPPDDVQFTSLRRREESSLPFF